MHRKIPVFILLSSFLFSTSTYASQYKFDFAEEPVIDLESPAEPIPAERPGMDAISQEEYGQKMHNAKKLKTVGWILTGTGCAALLGGFVVVLASGSRKKLSDMTSQLGVGFLTMVGGAAIGIPGAVIVSIGKSREKKLKKMNISISPLFEPQKQIYGLAFTTNF